MCLCPPSCCQHPHSAQMSDPLSYALILRHLLAPFSRGWFFLVEIPALSVQCTGLLASRSGGDACRARVPPPRSVASAGDGRGCRSSRTLAWAASLKSASRGRRSSACGMGRCRPDAAGIASRSARGLSVARVGRQVQVGRARAIGRVDPAACARGREGEGSGCERARGQRVSRLAWRASASLHSCSRYSSTACLAMSDES